MRRYLDTKDSKSTSNLKTHAIKCWGENLVKEGLAARDRDMVKEALLRSEMKDGRITAIFKRAPGSVVTFSLAELSYTETR